MKASKPFTTQRQEARELARRAEQMRAEIGHLWRMVFFCERAARALAYRSRSSRAKPK